ncbi:SDR family oxidoreductase [bacterium]|nr:SDR family oxidoreductase [bacterium]
MTKNVLITGGSKGIGKSIASQLAKTGYNVFICARNLEMLKQTANEIGAKGFFACDITKPNDCKKIIKETGGIDILINNAGQYVWASVEKTQDQDIEKLIELNIKAPYNLIKLCVPYMKQQKWGRIVNIGSISGIVGEANASLYSMTKSAFTGLTKALGLELAEYGITINTINPGWVKTELADNAVGDSDFSEDEIVDMIPQKRFIEPDEIANLVKYIISDESKGMTAQNISLCAGLSAG